MDNYKSIQTQDTPIRFDELPQAYVRCLYERSMDSRAHGSAGQDYMRWLYKDNALLFAVCDGVSGSFCGHIAAQVLGDSLVDDLLKRDGRKLEEDCRKIRNESELESFIESLRSSLNSYTRDAADKVQDVELPPDLPPLQREALRQLKTEHGSETVFVCGRLNFGDQGKHESPSLMLIWMGDTVVRLFDRQGQLMSLPDEWKNSDRWSSKRGPYKGRTYVWLGNVDKYQIGRIIVFSDGLAAVAEDIHKLEDDELQEAVGRQLMSPSSDDISFLDIGLKPFATDDAEPPQLTSDHKRINWLPISGGQKYEVEESANGVFHASNVYPAQGLQWDLEESKLQSKAAYRYYRIRAQVGGQVRLTRAVCWEPPPLAVPQLLRIEPPDQTPYTVSWSEVEGAQYYVLVEKFGQRPDREIYLGHKLEYTVASQTPGAYRYCVYACGPPGKSKCSEEYPIEIKPNTVVLAPAQLAGSTTLGPGPQVALLSNLQQARPVLEKMGRVAINARYWVKWSPVADAEFYELQVASNGISVMLGRFSPVALVAGLSHEVVADQVGTFYYRVRALRGGSVISDWSDPQLVEVAPTLNSTGPGQARNLTTLGTGLGPDTLAQAPLGREGGLPRPTLGRKEAAVTAGTYHQITWNSVPGAQTYELQFTDGSGKFQQAYEGSNTWFQTQYDQPGTYYYWIRAIGVGQESDWSDYGTINVEPAGAPLPEAPRLKPIANPGDTDSYLVEWTRVDNAVRYALYESNSPDFNSAHCVYDGQMTMKRFRNREPGDYYYRVASLDGRNRYSATSSNMEHTSVRLARPRWITLKKYKEKDDSVVVTLCWESVKGATRYDLQNANSTIKIYPLSNLCEVALPQGTVDLYLRAISQKGSMGEWGAIRIEVYVSASGKLAARIK